MRSPDHTASKASRRPDPVCPTQHFHGAFQPPPRPPHFTEEDPEPLKGRLPGGSEEGLAQRGLPRAKGRDLPSWAGAAGWKGQRWSEAGAEGPSGPGPMPGKGAIESGRWEKKGRLLRPMVPLRVPGPRSRTQGPADSPHASR